MADQRSPRVLMSGAGTGGHLYPGIAVALEIRRRHPRSEVVFAGTGRDLEVRALDRLGFDLVRVHSAGLKGKSVGALVRGLSTLPLGAWDAWRVITRVAPQVVIGLGGYSSGAVVLICGAAPHPDAGARAERTARHHKPATGAGSSRPRRCHTTGRCRISTARGLSAATRCGPGSSSRRRRRLRSVPRCICWCSGARRAPMPSTSR